MGAIRDKANIVYADGPSSSPTQPPKPDVRELFGMVEDALQGAAADGILWTPNTIRVRSTANVTISSGLENGDTLNGVTLATGNHVFLGSQTTPSQNGLYTVVASGAASRATFADSAAELAHIGFVIQEGTVGIGERWTLPLDADQITVGSTSLAFALAGIETGTSAEVATARQGTDSLSTSINAALSTALTETAERIFDPNTPVFRSGERGVRLNILPTGAAGHAQPFDWDGTSFDWVKVWIRPAVTAGSVRVRIWSSDRNTLYATGYATIFRLDDQSHVWVKLDRAITTSVVSAGVLYLSVDNLLASSINKQVIMFDVNDRNVPSLVTYPLYYTTWDAPQTLLQNWSVEADTGSNGVVFELYSSTAGAKRTGRFSNPRSDEIIMTPRLCGIVGTEMNVYDSTLVSGRGKNVIRIGGIASPAKRQKDRWTMTPSGAVVAGTMNIRVYEPNELTLLGSKDVTVDIVAAAAAAAATRVICAIGDSTTANGFWTQRVIDNAAANASGVQPTFQGTQGTGANKHEGVGGRTLGHVYRPTTVPIAALNPFVTGVNQYFDATYYMSNNPSFATPEIVVWHLGINESVIMLDPTNSEANAQSSATAFCQMLGEMIGVFASANGVVPWSDVDPNIKHIVALHIAGGDQDGFGNAYPGTDYHEAFYHRYSSIYRNRIVKVFGDSEGDGIFLMPWHVTNDPAYGFQISSALSSVNSVHTIDRQVDSIHPYNAGLGGYQQMGDGAWAMLNVGVAKGWF